MDHIQIESELIEKLIKISKAAGREIMKIYSSDFDYQIKKDLSPLTKADQVSHEVICEQLKLITPDLPILSEEDSDISFKDRSLWKQYWLVDPLDGTKEFIKRNGEFTVNLALIENNKPIFGVIYVPSINHTYWGDQHKGSFFIDQDSNEVKINVSNNTKGNIKIAASRSHPSKDLSNCLEKIKNYELINIGSSLKFCLVAKGEADCYPRFGPTSEWDTAAGEAIAKYAGATIVTLENQSLNYNSKKDFINPSFIVTNNKINKRKFLSVL